MYSTEELHNKVRESRSPEDDEAHALGTYLEEGARVILLTLASFLRIPTLDVFNPVLYSEF